MTKWLRIARLLIGFGIWFPYNWWVARRHGYDLGALLRIAVKWELR